MEARFLLSTVSTRSLSSNVSLPGQRNYGLIFHWANPQSSLELSTRLAAACLAPQASAVKSEDEKGGDCYRKRKRIDTV